MVTFSVVTQGKMGCKTKTNVAMQKKVSFNHMDEKVIYRINTCS